MKVAVAGLGRLGLPMAALFAASGHDVTAYDVDAERVQAVLHRNDPVGEPGLGELLHTLSERQLDPTWVPAHVARSDVIFIVVPTPSDEEGAFSDRFVMEAIDSIGPHLGDRWRTVVVTSTVMPGTMDFVASRLEQKTGLVVGKTIGLAYSPEFIALGSVLADLAKPDFVLIGARDRRSADDVAAVLLPVTGHRPGKRTSFINAEVAKIALNTYVTMKISYANTLGEICDAFPDAEAREVAEIVGMDYRVGTRYLRPGGPFGGPCFPRDTVAFSLLANRVGASSQLADATRAVNERVIERVVVEVLQSLPIGGTVAILGLAYKPNTPVTEESLGMHVGQRLAKRGVEALCHDPIARVDVDWCQQTSAAEAVASADVVLIAQENPGYAALDYADKAVIDPWGVLA